jgi:protein required for attachment to host cells
MKTCIAIVDASRARLFVHTRSDGAGGLHDDLVERAALVVPGRRLREGARFSDSRPGANRVGTRQYGFDDHRGANVLHEDAAFAERVIDELSHLVADPACSRLVVCASPRMLGMLRYYATGLRGRGVVVDELSRDLVKLTVPELRDQLAAYGILPAATPPRLAAH